MKKDDYIIFKVNKENKDPDYHLGQAVKPSSEGLLVDLEKDRHFAPKRVEIPKEAIVLNLGDDPEPGIVYGQDLHNLYRGSIATDYGIDVHKFFKLRPKADDKVEQSLSQALKVLRANGLLAVTNLPVVYELKKKKSKFAGMFRSHKELSRITLFLENPDQVALNTYIWLHEMAHALDHYLIDSKELRARWVRLYIHTVKPTTLPLSEAKNMWKPLTGCTSIGEWKSCFSEDGDKAKTNLILRMIKQAHGVSVYDMNALMDADDFDTIKSLWPTTDLHSTELNPVITEYATKNVKETLAEALSMHLTGTKLPKQVIRLVDDTIQHAIGRGKDFDK